MVLRNEEKKSSKTLRVKYKFVRNKIGGVCRGHAVCASSLLLVPSLKENLGMVCDLSPFVSEHTPVLSECTFIIAVTVFTVQLVHANPYVRAFRAVA